MSEVTQLTDLYKKTGVIHIENKISLVGIKLFNVLLAHAYPDLRTKREHHIPLTKLFKAVPSARNIGHLKKTLREMSVTVEFNIFQKDSKKWGFFNLLPFAFVDEELGICRYSYVEQITELLITAVMYSKVNLMIQQKYRGGKYGWCLYELCLDYRKIEKTPVFTLSDFRRYMGIAINKYNRYKDFSHRVLKPAVADINKQTNLSIKIKTIKTGRKISHVQFLIHENKNFHLIDQNKELQKNDIIFNDLNTELADSLSKIGLSLANIRYCINGYPSSSIEEALQVYQEQKQIKEIRSPNAFIKEALKQSWKSKNSEAAVQTAEAEKQKSEEIKQKLEVEKEASEARNRLYINGSNEERFEYLINQEYPNIGEYYYKYSDELKKEFKAEMYQIFQKKEISEYHREALNLITEFHRRK